MGNKDNKDVSSWQIAEIQLEKSRKERIELEQTLEILRNITDKTRLKLAETELQTALARLAIIKEMKEENQQQEIPSTTEKVTELKTTSKKEVEPTTKEKEEVTTEKAPNSQKTNSPLLSKEQPAPTPKTPIPPSGNGQS